MTQCIDIIYKFAPLEHIRDKRFLYSTNLLTLQKCWHPTIANNSLTNRRGKTTVAGLASRGARVYMGARSAEKAEDAIADIKRELGNPRVDINFLKLGLTDFRKETTLHGLINNAGIMGVPFSLTKDGYEVQVQTNYLSHWLFTYHLLPLLETTALPEPGAARIVNVTSDGHERFTLKEGIRLDDPNLESESAMAR
ncbi:short-chain dehydrogenase, putative [Talaromyces stipitatus ATCC 10500]|uniref:Short-chain dehydrogenase, putative n=1 Tax=Talaromyces stipitatus (strain ATCC 10500 / CBS 375.48 / QM 6759 / NRRL 1006) TaxID=441959 RepID=B8MRV0_TALSN|nr:short-chain dehydrogenase, putative [Talaromyces stipitatus ATCC 10500]EED13284.1 short-chain dehydrogenase, putative [Talaromyces stipitatus ATCC 10500]